MLLNLPSNLISAILNLTSFQIIAMHFKSSVYDIYWSLFVLAGCLLMQSTGE
jgi:hypothetical protein